MMWWLKSGQVSEHQELSRRLGRDGTISRWLQKYRRGGLAKLLEVKTSSGRPTEIRGEVLEKLQARLNQLGGLQQLRGNRAMARAGMWGVGGLQDRASNRALPTWSKTKSASVAQHQTG